MEHYAGIDVSMECSSVCVVNASGKIVREAKVASEPEALIGWFGPLGLGLARIGLEAGPLAQWLYAAMKQAGLAVELLETRHVYEAFKSMPVKSDRNDARKIAQLMRLGWFRPVHCKSITAQEIRAMLTARKLVQKQTPRRREQLARDFARLRTKGRQHDADKLCRTHRRTGEGASEPSDHRAGAASGAGRSACRVQRFLRSACARWRAFMTRPGS
jgi:transposase